MPRVQAGEIHLGWREWGEGDLTVVFIHGNLASKDWIELAAPLFPSGLRVIGIDWRGCGESDRPPPAPDFANYSMRQHALDMLAALDELRIPFCHLATHSTGGIIAARMLLKQPERFGRVFALDPVTPLGMSFNAEQIGLFRSMMASREVTRAVMATAAGSLRRLFRRLVRRPDRSGVNWRSGPDAKSPVRPSVPDPTERSAAGFDRESRECACREGMIVPGIRFPV